MSTAVVCFPDAPLTSVLILAALNDLHKAILVVDTPPPTWTRFLQWSGYDHLDHELTLTNSDAVLASSYTIRKSLIRKHFLHRALSTYLVKQSNSILAAAVPRTWDLEIAWADELDDLFADELWDLSQRLDDTSMTSKWYILKAGMADRGNGIRLFDSKQALRAIFDQFDEGSDEEEVNENTSDRDIVTSQLRHFVIQEYLSDPLLINPLQTLSNTQSALSAESSSFKFHLRAYCIASGALTLYLWPHILALFSAEPYTPPSPDADGNVDLAPHLTNTSLQTDRGEAGVRLLSELVGCAVLSRPKDSCAVLAISDIADITRQTADILAEAFRAALASPVHFQPLPNAFELFGADLLVTHVPDGKGFQVHLLELNAEPAIELTGPRLRWVLEDMFKAIARVCVGPFFQVDGCQWENWEVGETRGGLRKCLEVRVRGLGGW